MKRIVAILSAVFMLSAASACPEYGKVLPEYESGYFIYAVRTEKEGSKKAYITGLTESGQEQTELILPQELDGIEMCGIGYDVQVVMGTNPEGNFVSEKLEKLYVDHNLILDNVWGYVKGTVKIPNCYIVKWYPENIVLERKGTIYGYKHYRENYYTLDPLSRVTRKVANVSYMYNYEESPNEGYYWVDSYEESVITFIPPEPQREDYTFAGWYKDAECMEAWDFEKDITGKELIIDNREQYNTYEGMYLYAKWEKRKW